MTAVPRLASATSGSLTQAAADRSVMDNAAMPQLKDYEVHDTGKSKFFVRDAPVASGVPIAITADFGWKGNDVNGEQVYIISGDCRVAQGTDIVTGPRAVVWIQDGASRDGVRGGVTVYLEREDRSKPLQIELNTKFVEARSSDQAWLGTFRTLADINLHIASPGSSQLDPDAIYFRANQMRGLGLEPETTVRTDGARLIPQTSQLTENITAGTALTQGEFAFRRIRILSRHDYEMTFSMEPMPTDANKRQCIINSGVTLVIEGIQSDGKTIADVVDISADRAVIWATGIDQITPGGESMQNKDFDLEVFLDGDIIFREGDRVIYAKEMYYDAKNRIGLIHDTEMVLPIPSTTGGYFRLKADTVRQQGPNLLTAKNTWVSTSMMGVPGYRLQSNQLTGEVREVPLFDAETQLPVIDPATGQQAMESQQYLIAENNFIAIGSAPVFYWPWMAMDASDQTLYIRSLKFGKDSIFGYQARTTWNPYQLLGIGDNRPDGTDWDLNLDYLSDRGLGHGTTFLYNRDEFFGCKTPALGMLNFYGISDKGTDNLGLGRRNVPFPHSYRYRGLAKHRQRFDDLGCFGGGWTLTGQFGTSSDRNFIPQYFENEWYTGPNPQTSLEMKKTVDNWSLDLSAEARLDKFYTETNQLPRLNHYWLGQPLFSNKLIWYEHTKIGYNQFKTTESPYAAADRDLFRYLDWELAEDATSNNPNSSGARTLAADSFVFSTRHELDVPLEAGPLKVTPYALGEYAFWGQGATEKNIGRAYGRGGVRLNLPVWKVDSDVSSTTWYLNGLAHKMNFGVDASWSGVSRHFNDLILYDPIDDWQTEEFRRRYSVTTFGNSGALGFADSIPVRFDERYYALRQGALAGAVTSPSTELAEDLSLVRFEWQNRWQTKRGPVAKRHTIDWITFNTGMNFYPKKEENFGEYVGLLDYDLRWHVGDRFSVLSSGLYDVFDDGQRITRLGVMSKRPSLGSLYVGVDRLAGPINSTYLNASMNYRMSEKWASSFGTSYDLTEGENVGQNLGISRIGESFVFSLGFNVNTSKDNFGVSLSVIPVFLLDKSKFEEGVLDYASW
ncbi:MAG: hypothetical protein Q4G68_02555 [Planctomycetia bacterium]|nr:hypothetical protein [Planctomycetia bacterium]